MRWPRLIWSVIIIVLGGLLTADQNRTLPALLWRYWPLLLVGWGVWLVVARLRSREDMWAGMDYGTGLYVIRHRRRRPRQWLPGVALIAIGAFFFITSLDPSLGIWFGPLAVIGVGGVSLVSSFSPPPKKDFAG